MTEYSHIGDLIMYKYHHIIGNDVFKLVGYFKQRKYQEDTLHFSTYELTQVLNVVEYLETGEINNPVVYTLRNIEVLYPGQEIDFKKYVDPL